MQSRIAKRKLPTVIRCPVVDPFYTPANYFHSQPGKPEEILWFLEPKLEALERPQAWVVGPKIAWVMFPSEIEALGNKRQWGHLFVLPGKHNNGLLHSTVLHDCIAL